VLAPAMDTDAIKVQKNLSASRPNAVYDVNTFRDKAKTAKVYKEQESFLVFVAALSPQAVAMVIRSCHLASVHID
jgi:hypothetical protein